MTQENKTSKIDPFKKGWNGLSSQAVADYFLDLSRQEQPNPIPLTNLKIQKLVYFAHFISLTTFKIPLISDEIEAWTYGPVIPSLYQSLKNWKDQPISGNIASNDNAEVSPIACMIIESTWDKLKSYSAGQLVNISHRDGSPWHRIWDNEKGKFRAITNNDIINNG